MKRTFTRICLMAILALTATGCSNKKEATDDVAILETVTKKTETMNTAAPVAVTESFDTVINVYIDDVIRSSSPNCPDTVYGHTNIEYKGCPVYVVWNPGLPYLMTTDQVRITSLTKGANAWYGTVWSRLPEENRLVTLEPEEEEVTIVEPDNE